MPAMISVESASLGAVGFDAEMQQLFVRFRKSGATYVYYGVAQHVFEELLRADSKGAFFNLRIRPAYEFAALRRTGHRGTPKRSGRDARR